MLRAKKFMASKLSESSAGRKVVIKFLGSAGDHILQALDSALTRHSGKNVAKEVRLNVFKLATKLGVLIQNNTLNETNSIGAREPAALFLNNLLDCLEGTSTNLAELRHYTRGAHDAILPIISPFMKPSNSARLTAIMTVLTGPFLDDFMNDPRFRFEREEIAKEMRQLMRPFEADVLATKEFQKERLFMRRNLLSQLIQNPSLEEYLRYEDTARVVRDWLLLTAPEHSHNLSFLNSVTDFKQISNRSLAETRAQLIFDKHLSPSGAAVVAVPPEILAGVQHEFDEGRIRKDMFDPAVQSIVSTIAVVFNEQFRGTEQYMDLQHELEMIDFKLSTQFSGEGVEPNTADLNLEELGSDDDALDAEDGETETKG